MELKICISGRFGSWEAGMDIPELYRREFEPLKTCDDPLIALAIGDVMMAEAQVVIRARKDAAEILAKNLAEIIVSSMERNDTHNGYRK